MTEIDERAVGRETGEEGTVVTVRIFNRYGQEVSVYDLSEGEEAVFARQLDDSSWEAVGTVFHDFDRLRVRAPDPLRFEFVAEDA